MRIIVNHLIERNGRLYFRRRVPDDIHHIVGKREWKKALGRRAPDALAATEEARQLTSLTDKWIREARRELAAGLDKAELAEAAESWARRNRMLTPDDPGRQDSEAGASEWDLELEKILARTLERSDKRDESELGEDDFDPSDWMKIQTVKQGRRVDVPMSIEAAARSYARNHKGGELAKAEDAAVNQAVAFFRGKPIEDIRRADVRDWILWLQDERKQSPGTIRRRFSSIVAIVSRAIEDHELDARNPFAGQKLPQAGAQGSEEKLPFHSSHLELIEAHLESPRVRLETKVLIRLMMDTTLGLKEAAGLEWADVRLDDDVPMVKVRPNSVRDLKTKNRVRDFPLSAAAVEAFRCLKQRQKSESGTVFSEKVRNYHSLSQRLNKAIRSAGVPKSPRLTAYSFRHTFEEAMRVAGVEPDLQRYLMGHGQTTMTERYGASRPLLERLKEAVDAARPERGKVDESNYREGELPEGSASTAST